MIIEQVPEVPYTKTVDNMEQPENVAVSELMNLMAEDNNGQNLRG